MMSRKWNLSPFNNGPLAIPPRFYDFMDGFPVFSWAPTWANNGARLSGSELSVTDDKFEVNLDVRDFAENEISVKVVENSVVVEAKHEEKSDDNSGFVSRHIVRRFNLPEGVVLNEMNCKMISDNTIVISAPRVGQKPAIQERSIPIAFVDKSASQASAN